MSGVDDLAMWITGVTDYTDTWTVTRFLPKWQFVVEYYGDEYRFSPDTPDAFAWVYSSADAVTF